MPVNYLHTEPEPYRHQADFLHWAYDKPHVALFAGIGTGKSRMLIDLAANRFAEGRIDSCLVIAPSGVQRQWADEQVPTFCAVPFETFMLSAGLNVSKAKEAAFKEFCRPSTEGKLRWLFTNVELFSRDTYLRYFRAFLRATRCFAIQDECQAIKSPDAKRTQNILRGLADVTMLDKRMVASKPLSAYRAIATGTMVTNSPYDLYSAMSFLKADYFRMPYSSFRSRYGLERTDHVPSDPNKQFRRRLSLKEMKAIREARARGMKDEVSARIFRVSEADIRWLCEHPDAQVPYKNLDELRQAIRPVSFIIRKEDCLDLPPQVYERRYVEPNPDQRRVYKDLCATLESEYRGVELTALNRLSLLVRLSQVTSGFYPAGTDADGAAVTPIGDSNPKMDALIDMLEEDGTFPCLVFCRFVAEAKEVWKRLNKAFPERRAELIHGGVGQEGRQDIIGEFKAGDVDVIVATHGTLGTGYNLQRASVAYFLSNSYSFEAREQTEGRIHRAGSVADKVAYVDFIMQGTIDERVYAVLREKRDLLEYMRGRRVGEFLGGGKAWT